MPGFYADGEYDVAGFIVGVVERERIVDGTRIVARRRADWRCPRPACTPTAIRSRGRSCSNAWRFGVDDLRAGARRDRRRRRCSRRTARTCRSFGRCCRGGIRIKGLAHITGGGITDNLPRVLPEGTEAVVAPWCVGCSAALPLARSAPAACRSDDMLRTFNMGVGLILVVSGRIANRSWPRCSTPANATRV